MVTNCQILPISVKCRPCDAVLNENTFLKLLGYKPSSWHKKCSFIHLHLAPREVSFDPEDSFHSSHPIFLINVLVHCGSTR
jgi:hypothetical protein